MARVLRIQSKVVLNIWEDADDDSPGYPLVHFTAKSDIERRDPALAGGGADRPMRSERKMREVLRCCAGRARREAPG